MFIAIIITGIVTSFTSIFAYSLIAENIGFTPHDSNWNVENVDAALNNLNQRTNQLSTYYSTEEQKVGRWIDNKPIYQRTFEQSINGSSGQWIKASFTIPDLDKLLGYDVKSNEYPSNNIAVAMLKNYYGDNTIGILTSNLYMGVNKYYITVLYTKTTD